VGGVFTAQDAWEKLAAGSSLVQVYTGWTYEGPWMVRRILDGLALALQRSGLRHIKELVGTGLPYPHLK
jgi:dihydroorotate dehydrogenase